MGDSFRTRMNGKPNGAKGGHARSGIVAALDIGSSKIACIIGLADQGGLRVLGAALRESRGIRSGAVTNIELAEKSIRETVEAAEQLAGQRIQSVILSVQCGLPKSLNVRAEGTPQGALVNDAHLRALLGDAKRMCKEDGYETIQAAPTGYVVDQSRGVSDPRGMYCERLGVSVHGVAVRSGPLQNLRLAVENCHLTIARQLYAPYASGLSSLTPDEMALGVTLIDIGGGCTSVAVFHEDALVHVDCVPLGGAYITTDIAKGLSTPLAAAERIKTLYGSALAQRDVGVAAIEVPLMGEEGERGNNHVRRADLTNIIQARLGEIFTEVQTRLRKSGFDVSAGRRAVLTGGGSQLAGARDLAEQILNKKVRLGRPQTFPGLPAATAGPAYATALGLLISGATSPPESNDPNPPQEESKSQWDFLSWLKFWE